MTWFRSDDGLAQNRKVLSIPRAARLRLAAMGLWTLAGTWCSANLTDGIVPGYMVDELGADEELVAALVGAGLWHREGHDCGECAQPEAGGFVFHQWAERNPTREQVEAERAAARERMQRRRRAGSTPELEAPFDGTTPGSSPERSGDVRANTTPNGDRTSASVRDPRPDPTRPTSAPTVRAASRRGRGAAADPLFDSPDTPPTGTDDPNAGALVASWISDLDERPPSRVVGQIAREVRQLLQDGIPSDDVAAGLTAWQSRGLHPSTLASVVHEQRTSRATKAPERSGFAAYDAVIAERRAAAAAAAGGGPG